jgi:hypothetical protein
MLEGTAIKHPKINKWNNGSLLRRWDGTLTEH